MHVSEEFGKNSHVGVWSFMLSTFIFKLIFALTFLVPVLLLSLKSAVVVSVIWGFVLIGGFSYYVALKRKVKAWKVVGEHLAITVLVIVVTYLVGVLVRTFF